MAIIWYHFGRARSSGAHAILSQSEKPKLCRLCLDRSSLLHIALHYTLQWQICSEQLLFGSQPTNQPTSHRDCATLSQTQKMETLQFSPP